MITPEMLAAAGTEEAHQQAFMCWCAQNARQLPALKYVFHVPNGGKRDRITASNMKAAGVKPGVPDLILPVGIAGYKGWIAEMKVGKNKPTDAQRDWIKHFQSENWATCVPYGWEQTRDCVLYYLNLGPSWKPA